MLCCQRPHRLILKDHFILGCDESPVRMFPRRYLDEDQLKSRRRAVLRTLHGRIDIEWNEHVKNIFGLTEN
eukprot:UN09101